MRKMMLLAAVSAIGISVFGECHSSVFDGGEFSLGCNYWASHAGMHTLAVFNYGKGKVVYFNAAIEVNAQDVAWPVYRAAAREAGIQRLVETTGAVRTVGFTEHPAADGMGFVVAVNYAPEKTAYPVRIDGRVKRVWNGECADGKLTIGANDGCVIQLEW